MNGLYVKHGERTASFSGMINGKGEFLSGIADMEILSHIPESHLNNHNFQKTKILVVDSNISDITLQYILNNSSEVETIIYEPISKEKSTRILYSDLLSKIQILKPNIMQLRDIYLSINKDLPDFDIHSHDIEYVSGAVIQMSKEIFRHS